MFKKIDICKKIFMSMFNRNFAARNTLKGAGGFEDSKAGTSGVRKKCNYWTKFCEVYGQYYCL